VRVDDGNKNFHISMRAVRFHAVAKFAGNYLSQFLSRFNGAISSPGPYELPQSPFRKRRSHKRHSGLVVAAHPEHAAEGEGCLNSTSD
jgi:hypothetical protein